jgi:hypothetical protein
MKRSKKKKLVMQAQRVEHWFLEAYIGKGKVYVQVNGAHFGPPGRSKGPSKTGVSRIEPSSPKRQAWT